MSIKIFFCGDVHLSQQETAICSNVLDQMIKKCDYAVCNFEGPVENQGSKIIKSGPHISQDTSVIRILKDHGFNLLLLANNHIFDYGPIGVETTIQTADKYELQTVGAGLDENVIYQPVVVNINKHKVAIVNACEAQFGVLDSSFMDWQFGYAWINHTKIDDTIIKLKDQVDSIIVCAHAGLEDFDAPLYEWRERYRRLCDMGADCVIGTHPHVPQGYELYKGKLIFYSLGNFIFKRNNSVNDVGRSYSVILTIDKNSIKYRIIHHYVNQGIVDVSDIKNQISMQKLNTIMNDDDYMKDLYIHAYDDIIEKYYYSSIKSNVFDWSIKRTAYRIYSTLFNRYKVNQQKKLLLMHLIRNESYRWVSQRALNMKYNRNNIV